MRRLGHVPALDGLRGIAILLVLMRHTFVPARWALGGSLGVDLFFVLSGFLITSLLIGEWSSSGTLSLRSFYRRRARRLLPALLAFVGVALVVSVALHPGRAPSFVWLAALRLSYASNFLAAFTRQGVGTGFKHLWSLAEEEQFYLLWPILLVALLRRGRRPRVILGSLLAVAFAVNLERLLVVAHGASIARVWFAPDTHADPIMYGCAAGIIYSYRIFLVPKRLAELAGVAAAAIVAVYTQTDGRVGFYPIVLLPVFCVAVAVFLLGVAEHDIGARALSARPLVAFGAISYALYLWHPLTLNYFGPAGMPIAILLAAVSYVVVEEPFMRRRRQSATANSTAINGDVAVGGGVTGLTERVAVAPFAPDGSAVAANGIAPVSPSTLVGLSATVTLTVPSPERAKSARLSHPSGVGVPHPPVRVSAPSAITSSSTKL